MIDRELLKGSISVMVLELLSQKDMYGYEIIRELERRSENVFSFKEGTLYSLLHTLEKRGHIYSYWEDTTLERKRKYYHITEKGVEEHRYRLAQWKVFSKSVNQVLGGEHHVEDRIGLFERRLQRHSKRETPAGCACRTCGALCR